MKEVLEIHKAPDMHWVGDGFPVRQLIAPGTADGALDPFLMLDYAEPTDFKPTNKKRGVGQHPHRGFETVTVVYQGELEHRDSTGAGGVIGPGDVQWMTAAGGILHEEFHSAAFAKSGGTMEMVQLWVNLPAKHKNAPPGYQTLIKKDIPSVELPGGAGHVRVIAGDYQGHNGPAHTFTPINLWDVSLAAAKKTVLTIPNGHSTAIVVLRGVVNVNHTHAAHPEQLVVFSPTGNDITLESTGGALVLIMSGVPIKEPVAAHGPFVMNTIGEIKQAMLDFQNGRFGAMT